MGELQTPAINIGDVGGMFLVGLGAAILFQTGVFLVAHRLRRYDLIDSTWGPTFIVLTWTWFAVHREGGVVEQSNDWVAVMVGLMVSVWGLRLSWHIFRRFLRSSSEDKRYVELRSRWKSSGPLMIFGRIFVAQALLASFVALPVLGVMITTDYFSWSPGFVVYWMGVAVWCVGLAVEAIADRQLRGFLADPKNKGTIMDRGLWRYSRHPNYFGEITLWWGIGIMAVGASIQSSWWLVVLIVIGPALITHLITRVSGIPPLEKAFAGRPGWAEYQRRTSVLLPLPPRK